MTATNGASACGLVSIRACAQGVNSVILLSVNLYICTWLTMATTWFHILTYFPFLQSRTWLFVHCNLPVFYPWDTRTFHKRSCKIHYFLPRFWPTKSPRENLLLPQKYQTTTIGNDGVSRKALRILPALFHRWYTTRLWHQKKYPYTVLECLRCSDYDILSTHRLFRFWTQNRASNSMRKPK